MEGREKGMIRSSKNLFIHGSVCLFLFTLSGEAQERKAAGKGEERSA